MNSAQLNITVTGANAPTFPEICLEDMPAYCAALHHGFDGLSCGLRGKFHRAEITAPQIACAAVSLAAAMEKVDVFPTEFGGWPTSMQKDHYRRLSRALKTLGFDSLGALCRKDPVMFFDMIEGGWANVA